MAQTYSQHKLISIFAVAIGLAACVSSPSIKYQKRSQAYGFSEQTISSGLFDHAVFSNRKVEGNSALHIYIEGDGQPFLHQRYINQDPTSFSALSLELMRNDPNPSVLVGRPCYHARRSTNCLDSKWWTSHRYSEQVVSSMAQAINQLNSNENDIVLIGFSGGGSIAMLLASRLDKLKKIITINANLDIDAWTQHHAYTPLSGSLNPINYLEQAAPWPQVHLVGERDQNIPYDKWISKIKSPNVHVITYPEFNHTCCWKSVWQQVLSQHAAEL